MTLLRLNLAALALISAALPAMAGGFDVSLPRFDFPASGADTTRGCAVLTSPVAPTCAPAK